MNLPKLTEKQEMWLAISAVIAALLIIAFAVWMSAHMIAGSVEASGSHSVIQVEQYNVGSRNPTWGKVKEFIIQDSTDHQIYDSVSNDCKSFATQVQRNAKNAGLGCGLVVLGKDFDTFPNHVINAFNTSDFGLVFVDCTGDDGNSSDYVAYIQKGKEYGLIQISDASNPNSYSFYEGSVKLLPSRYTRGHIIVEEYHVLW